MGQMWPMATTAKGGWPATPSSPFPLVPHGGAKEKGCPLPPIYRGATWRKLIKEKSRLMLEIPRPPPRHPPTSPPLSLPAAPSKGCVREGNLPRYTPLCCGNSAKRSTSATSAGSEGLGVVVIHRTCMSTRGCHCGTSRRTRIITTTPGPSDPTEVAEVDLLAEFRQRDGVLRGRFPSRARSFLGPRVRERWRVVGGVVEVLGIFWN